MPLRELLKKKDKANDGSDDHTEKALPVPEFKFMRSDTHTQEILSFPEDDAHEPAASIDSPGDVQRSRLSQFTGRSRSQSTASNASRSSETSKSKDRSPNTKRLSQRLGLRKQESSTAVPQDLPEIKDGQEADGDAWEQRATMLARENKKNRSRPGTPVRGDLPDLEALKLGKQREDGIVASQRVDDTIQEAIRLHEAGQLEEATRMFGRLADLHGENNALSQVLYGLALR